MSAINGKNLLLELSEDAGVTFKPIAGLVNATITRENTTEENTSQTNSDTMVTHNFFVGRSGITIAGDGIADDTTDVSKHLFKTFVATANSNTPEALLRFSEVNIGTWEGIFIISTFETTRSETTNITFSSSFLNKADVVFTPAA